VRVRGIGSFSIDRKNDNYHKGLEYLTTIYMLSKCNALIAGQCGGTTGAVLLSKNHEFSYLWDLGYY
jgi:hypothetical protein